ncbi:SPOR domain-containing protein [Paenibacillus sp. YIM B09110]|uniref:SPOR domain-containing protein n=1 Tax=Paenibacillus sp. YIM B09110 TaxID=3126102 RepID=UPI00301D6D30
MSSKNRITYRFDHAGRNVTDKPNKEVKRTDTHAEIAGSPAKSNVVPLYPPHESPVMSELTPWNSPFQEDIVALEQLIRDTEPKSKETASGKLLPNFPVKDGVQGPILLNKLDAPLAPTESDPFESVLLPIDDSEEERKPLAAAAKADNGLNYEYADELFYDETEDLSRNKGKYKAVRYKRPSSPPSWFNVFLSVAGALATGALFGYLLLSLFTGSPVIPGGDKASDGKQPAAVGTDADQPAIGGVGVSDPDSDPKEMLPDEGDPVTDGPMAALTGLEQTYYLLQFGVFSNTEGRDTALAQLKDKGLAAASLATKDDYRVFAGIAGNKVQATALRAAMTDTELFVKALTVSAPAEIPFDGDAAGAQLFFERTKEVVQMLDDLALAQLEQPALSPLSDAASDAWENNYQLWKQSIPVMQKGTKSAEHLAFLDSIVTALDNAAKAMLEYDKKPSAAHLWSAQSSLMAAVIAQKGWFESISAL